MVDMEKLSNCLDNGKDDDVILPGFRFHPTDEELVGFYLRRKVEKKPLSIELIKHIDIYKYDPWDLPMSAVGDKEWYFFCIRERKYRNSIRPNRVTGSGFWKATGIDRPVYSVGSEPPHECIGLKKSLVYYRGSAGKGTKTDWMMHEFRLPPGEKLISKLPNSKNTTAAAAEEAEIWTLCRIFKRNVSYKKFVPNWRATNSAPVKQTVTDSSSTSQTCSFESVNIDKYTSFGPSMVVQQMKEKASAVNYINQNSNVFADQLSSISTSDHHSHHHHDPVAAISSNFPNSNSGNNDFFRDGSWDELGRMLEFSSDSSFPYGCR